MALPASVIPLTTRLAPVLFPFPQQTCLCPPLPLLPWCDQPVAMLHLRKVAVEIPFPNILSPETQSVNLFCFSMPIFLCATWNFRDLKLTKNKMRRPGPLSSKANKQFSRNSRFYPDQRFDKESSIITSSKFCGWKHMKRIKAIGCAKRDSLVPMARTPSKCWGTCRCAHGISRRV